jgi:hypothetical protein
VDYAVTLRGKENDDGVEEAEQGEWGYIADEVFLVIFFAEERAEGEAG